MAIKIDSKLTKAAYVNTSRVKHIYLDKKLVFSDMICLNVTLGIGVASYEIKCTRVDGDVSVISYTTSTSSVHPYGSTLTITATASTGYTIDSYTSSLTLIEYKELSITATPKSYWTDINLNYNGTQYGLSCGDKIGTFYYSTNNANFYGPYSNEPWTGDTKFAYDSYLYLRSISAAPGFYLSSVNYNGNSIGSLGGTYAIKIGDGSYNVDINYSATTNSSSTSFSYAKVVRTNSLSKNAFTVNCSIDIDVEPCGAGTTIGTIPYQYRPSTAKTFSTTWQVTTGTHPATTYATITVHPSGAITSDTISNGTDSASGGGKWGAFANSWVTKMTFSGSWSVI